MRWPIVIKVPIPAHDARDFRLLAALLLLAGGGPATSLLLWLIIEMTAAKSAGPYPLAYIAFGLLILQFVIFTGISCVLGRRKSGFSIGKDGVHADSEGGDDGAG